MDASADIDKPASSRRTRKKERTRREIYEAAMGLFNEKDYDDVTIGDICERADVAKATFFLHFPNKAALLTAFSEQMTQKIIGRLEGFNRSAVDQLEILRAIVLDEWARHGDVLRQFLGESVRFDDPASETSLTALVTDIIRAGQAAGECACTSSASRAASSGVPGLCQSAGANRATLAASAT